jgi:hypothetical protein
MLSALSQTILEKKDEIQDKIKKETSETQSKFQKVQKIGFDLDSICLNLDYCFLPGSTKEMHLTRNPGMREIKSVTFLHKMKKPKRPISQCKTNT